LRGLSFKKHKLRTKTKNESEYYLILNRIIMVDNLLKSEN